MYIILIQIHIRKLQLKKIIIKYKKNVGCKRDSMERPLVNIYKYWNFDNRFLVMHLHMLILIKHLLLLYLKKLIRINKLMSLSIET